MVCSIGENHGMHERNKRERMRLHIKLFQARCECVRYHREAGEIPGCFFPKAGERTYDCSIGNFIKFCKK
jgi:hypothetical protein